METFSVFKVSGVYLYDFAVKKLDFSFILPLYGTSGL
jgi:hypothetical protein